MWIEIYDITKEKPIWYEQKKKSLKLLKAE